MEPSLYEFSTWTTCQVVDVLSIPPSYYLGSLGERSNSSIVNLASALVRFSKERKQLTHESDERCFPVVLRSQLIPELPRVHLAQVIQLDALGCECNKDPSHFRCMPSQFYLKLHSKVFMYVLKNVRPLNLYSHWGTVLLKYLAVRKYPYVRCIWEYVYIVLLVGTFTNRSRNGSEIL